MVAALHANRSFHEDLFTPRVERVLSCLEHSRVEECTSVSTHGRKVGLKSHRGRTSNSSRLNTPNSLGSSAARLYDTTLYQVHQSLYYHWREVRRPGASSKGSNKTWLNRRRCARHFFFLDDSCLLSLSCCLKEEGSCRC